MLTARLPFKALLIGLSLLLGGAAVAERLGSLGASPALVVYLGLYAFLCAALLLGAWTANPLLRTLYALGFAASAFFLDSFERITAEHLTYDAYINMLQSVGFAGDAAAQHGRPMAWAGLVALLLFAGMILPPGRGPRFAALGPLAGVALLSAMLFVRGGDGARGLPAPFTPLAYSSLYLYETGLGAAGARREVALRPAKRAAPGDIVLIVDESIAGQYLDLNRPDGVRSGLAQPRAGAAIHNYGYAASITNCSIGTNLTLRFGGTREDYQAINATGPSIWSYAKRAGLGTVYIDAQRTGGHLHNQMSGEERAAIDSFVQFDGVPVRDRDMAAADRLAAFLADDKDQFILVNKVGAHFPVHDKYPDSHMRYRPVLPRGGFTDISDTGSRAGFGGSPEDWRRYRNSYRNTLLWNVGGFFDRLFARADLSRSTLIYTGDHGQDLHERGNPGLATHCSSDPAPQEGLVPLVVIEGAGRRTLDWGSTLAVRRDHVSHYGIFPTLLALMGYSDADVGPLYGDSLASPAPDRLSFNARFNARLGREPDWRSIDPARIPPPPSDEGR
ncbi:MAG TPA: sulfatase-like hydrolase/transferase [Allosphingosinicella sp.]